MEHPAPHAPVREHRPTDPLPRGASRVTEDMRHTLGLRSGRLGVVSGFGDRQPARQRHVSGRKTGPVWRESGRTAGQVRGAVHRLSSDRVIVESLGPLRFAKNSAPSATL